MNESNIFQTLSRDYYQFTASEKRVADYLISCGTKAQFMSISELADASGVADATVSRFCRRLNYKSFAAFKLAIATSTLARDSAGSNPLSGETTSDDTFSDMAAKLADASIESIRETQSLVNANTLNKAADLLFRSNKVLCMGQGGSMLLAEEAAHLFSTSFPGFFPVSGSHMQSIYTAQLTPQDAILYFSYSGTTTDLIDVLRVTKPRGIPLILVTRFPNSPGAAQADIVLECGSRESPLQLGSIPARIAQLYLIDLLFSEMSRRDLEHCKDQRARVADALAGKHI